MKTIWKAPLNLDGVVYLPANARVLSVQMQNNEPMVWALVDTDVKSKENMRLNIYGTGHSLPENPGRFIGSIQSTSGLFVFHVFQPE